LKPAAERSRFADEARPARTQTALHAEKLAQINGSTLPAFFGV